MGSLAEIQAEAQTATRSFKKAEPSIIDYARYEHAGVSCRSCGQLPIIGKCYKCTVCSDFYNCQKCFIDGTHLSHSLQFRETAAGKWHPAVRPTSMRAGIPGAIVQQLLSREISDSDYDLLLQLDQPTLGATMTMTALNNIKHLTQIATAETCLICNHRILTMQVYRQLPCGHYFHRDCVDSWLLHQKATCPLDGMSAMSESSIQRPKPKKKPAGSEILRSSSTNETPRAKNTILPALIGR